MTYLKSDMGVVLRNESCIDSFRISRKIGCNYQVRSDLYLQPNRLSNMFFSDFIFIVGLFPLRTYKTKMVLWYWLLSRKLNDFLDFMGSRPQPVRDHVVSIKGRSNSIDKMPKFWRLLVWKKQTEKTNLDFKVFIEVSVILFKLADHLKLYLKTRDLLYRDQMVPDRKRSAADEISNHWISQTHGLFLSTI